MQNKLEVTVRGFVAHYPIKANHKLAIMGIGVNTGRDTEYLRVLVFGEGATKVMQFPKGMTVEFTGDAEMVTKKTSKGASAKIVVRTLNVDEVPRAPHTDEAPHYVRGVVAGNLERDPRPSQTRNGTVVSNFEVVAGRCRKGKYSKERVALSAFDKLGVACNTYLYRGRQVSAEGDVALKYWTDRNGLQQASLTMMASKVKFLAHTRAKQSERACEKAAAAA